MGLLQTCMASGSRVAPGLFGRLGFHLFGYPPSGLRGTVETAWRGKLPSEAVRTLRRARQLRIPVEDGDVLAYDIAPATPGRPGVSDAPGTVAVVHGWGSRAAFMVPLARDLLASGKRCILIDLPAHGAAGGQTINMLVAAKALRAVEAQTGPWEAIVGHSFGGGATVLAVSDLLDDTPAIAVDRLVLVAAPDSIRGVFERAGAAFGLNGRAIDVMCQCGSRVAGRSIDDFRLSAAAGRSAISTLVLHAPEDKEVPFADALAYGAHDTITLHEMPGAGHRRIVFSGDARKAVTRFICGTQEGGPQDGKSGSRD